MVIIQDYYYVPEHERKDLISEKVKEKVTESREHLRYPSFDFVAFGV